MHTLNAVAAPLENGKAVVRYTLDGAPIGEREVGSLESAEAIALIADGLKLANEFEALTYTG